MNYKITNKYVIFAITRQEWKPNFQMKKKTEESLVFDNANDTNNKDNVAKIATKLLKTTNE